MRFLVDTSVWSLALRRKGPAEHPAVRKLAMLLEHDEELALTATILQEVLQGFRDDASFRRLEAHLRSIPILPLEREVAVLAARIHRLCAARGVAATTVDCQIAAAASAHRCHLLTADRDFEHIARVFPLKLA